MALLQFLQIMNDDSFIEVKPYIIDSCILCGFRYAHEQGTQPVQTNCPNCYSSLSSEVKLIDADVARMLLRGGQADGDR